MKRKLLITGILFSVLLLPLTVEGKNFGIGLRGGFYLMPNWSDSYDVVYDNGGELTYGLEFDYRLTSNLEIGLAVDLISGDGERVWPDDSGHWVPSGESVTFDIQPVTLFSRWYFSPESSFSVFAGLGLGFAQFKETDGNTESGMGFLGLAGVSYLIASNVQLLLEGDYSTYPDVIGKGDMSEFFNEDDIGGLTISFALKYLF